MNKDWSKRFILLGAIFAMLSVAFGAFGSHILEERLSADRLDTFQTAVTYQFMHAFALMIVGILLQVWQDNTSMLRWAGILFVSGILIFSGSLYILTLSGITVLGAVTPLGGVAFITGWVLLCIRTVKQGK
ncbi:DUF423 domain-containing protein [Longirhabdus pacifica]|uniref:DUF423 domain-containing protein n=1 Tax=Longirhabdus pacifica TaxID=2305227 RepID=UPI00100880BF|nr:DUF423 domain-containing protein [Longirhabdus pacifica]